MRRTFFMGKPPVKEKNDNVGVGAGRSSASLRRLTGKSERDLAFQWGWRWSRSETARLVRTQAVARGWLLRRKVCRIPARDVEAVLKDLHQKDKGLRRLFGYLFFFILFFAILLLESDVTFQYSVETGIRDFIAQIGTGPDDLRLSEIVTREDFCSWALSLFMNMYDGSELENVCNTCASVREVGGFHYFPSIDESLWGTSVPLAASDGSESFVIDFDSCPLCYGSDRDAVVAASAEGEDFCNLVCSGMEFCFEGDCADYDEVRVTVAEVKGTNGSQVLVSSNSDCSTKGVGDEGFARDFGARIGLTSVVAPQPEPQQEFITLYPVGRGYIANRNRVLGGLLAEWTYYEDAVCEDTYRDLFYKTCFKDVESLENKTDLVLASLMNPLANIYVNDGSSGHRMLYSTTIDAGVYNSGLNFNLCSMLAIFGGTEVITDAVRSVSLRFNTYNGQMQGLFAAVDITAVFSLGGEVQIDPGVEIFSMPSFFERTTVVMVRAAAMVVFGIMLAHYCAKDLRHLMTELKDGRHRLRISFRRMPITTATIVHICGDAVFLGGLVLWISTAAYSSEFELTPTLEFATASEQVRAFSEELAQVARDRWKRDAFAVAGGMIGLARLFLMLRFHPRLSLVTDVLAASAVHLVHFFIMFFMVVGVYTNICWVIFGASSSLFATWTAAFVSMTRIALGEFDSIYPGMVIINPESAFVIIATYQTLQFVLLLNIVVSILLDAFQMVQKRNSSQTADTLRQTVTTTLGRWRIRLVNSLCATIRPGSSRAQRASPSWVSGPQNSAQDPLKSRWRAKVHHRRSPGSLSSSSAIVTANPLQTDRHNGAAAAASPSRHHPPVSTAGPTKSFSAAVFARLTCTGGIRDSFRSTKSGLTMGQRIAASHRHYDMSTAAEVLRRSPLPEAAVWRKMRQIVGARLAGMSVENFSRSSVASPGKGKKATSRSWSER